MSDGAARYLMTHSLLSSWLYMLESTYESADRDPMDEFMKTLRREPTPTTEAMMKGRNFEDLVTAISNYANTFDGIPIRDHAWFTPAKEAADIVRGGIMQYAAKQPTTVNGVDLLMYGRFDVLKAGRIYDIKFTSRYDVGKYFDSTQHPMYMFLVPEAESFTYLASNGTNLWRETYRREETGDILITASQFLEWLKGQGLEQVYFEHWGAK